VKWVGGGYKTTQLYQALLNENNKKSMSKEREKLYQKRKGVHCFDG
jgi:hypothetical protein